MNHLLCSYFPCLRYGQLSCMCIPCWPVFPFSNLARQTEARNEHDYAQKPLIIFQESGKTVRGSPARLPYPAFIPIIPVVKYRPFTDPGRIRCIDSKKNRTNGVPEGFLQIMVPSSQVCSLMSCPFRFSVLTPRNAQTLSSPKQEKSASPDLKAVTSLPPSASPGCEPQPDSESPSALREVSPFSYSCFPVSPSLSSSVSSSSSSTRSSPFLPPTLLATPSTYQSSSPAYTPFPSQNHPRPSAAQTQGMFSPSCPKNRTSLPTWQASNEGLIGIDLEDPAVFAQALEMYVIAFFRTTSRYLSG